ncbi:MAG TPA: basic secretory protein-like protein [Polyangia bacterium]|nr:basic secretory protein-like protein [Polyangia bacterium]
MFGGMSCASVRHAAPRPLVATAAIDSQSVVVTVDHNDAEKASPLFYFATVPAPRPSAAWPATFELTDGRPDGNSRFDALHDGTLPQLADQPEQNFFFQNGSNGGRFRVDLGRVIDVKEIDSYSWHPDERAPQIYRVYGSDGSGAGFVAKPTRALDPTQCGWRLIASVDTRQKFADAGGQYGASISRPGATLGRFRYLLFDVSRSSGGVFGNTFLSEIVIVDRDVPACAYAAPSSTLNHIYDRGGVRLTFTNEEPAIGTDVTDRLVQTFYTVYPPMMAEFNRYAPKHVHIIIDKRYSGVAATSGTTIHLGAQFFRQHPDALDVVTHEAMHVVQSYRSPAPLWLIEGIADYARNKFGVDNHDWKLAPYHAGQKYEDSYTVAARFLTWLDKHQKGNIIVLLDRALREGKYSTATWVALTGKSVDDLWRDYASHPEF